MIAALARQGIPLRASFTLSGVVEAFMDPLTVVAVLYGCAAYYGERLLSPPYLILGALAFALTFPGTVGLHETPRTTVRKIATNWLLFVLITASFGYASDYLRYFPQSMLLAWAAATPAALAGAHFLARSALSRWMSTGDNQRIAVIAGANDIGRQLLREFREHPYLGTRVVGFFDDRPLERLGPAEDEVRLLGRLSELAEVVKRHRFEAIYLALPMAPQPRILALLDDLKDTTASIYFVPDIFVTDLIQGRLDKVGGMPVVAVCETPFTGFNNVVKCISDYVLATLILLLLGPLLLAVAVGVKLSSPGPVIFKQRRYGLDGREILVYKFRSMTAWDDGDQVRQATRGDSRVTPFGAFIRRTSMDELPQFLNVLQGRMSIVGPRPHAVAHNETYRKLIKGYMIRHKVKPGITGWAQVNGYRGETETVDKMQKRIEYDLDYLRNWSLSLDLWIIFKTVLVVLRDRHAY